MYYFSLDSSNSPKHKEKKHLSTSAILLEAVYKKRNSIEIEDEDQ